MLKIRSCDFSRWSNGLLTTYLSILLVVAVALLVGCSDKDDAWPRIEREGVLRVGLDPTFPPFEVTADSVDSAESDKSVESVESGVVGLDVDLAHALASLRSKDIVTRSGPQSTLYRFKIDLVRRWISITRPAL